MLKNLQIKGSKSTYFVPEVDFNATSGKCSISGESYLENAALFYNELNAWLTKFCEAGQTPIHLTLNLTYFNTSSSRALLGIFCNLKELKDKGHDITVVWMYPEPDDSDLLMEAEDFINESELAMELVAYQEEG